MPRVELSLADVGLMTVAEAAAEHAVDVRTVQRWIKDGLLPVIPLAVGGERTLFLLLREHVLAVERPPRGGARPRKRKG